MPGPGNFALHVYQGDSYRWEFVLWLDGEKERPADLTEARAEATIRLGQERVSLPCGVLLPNVVVLVLSAAVSAHMSGNGLWDLRLLKPDGEVQTLVRGPVSVMAGVSVGNGEVAAG